MATELILVRHGQTELSARRALNGLGPADLNEEGLRQVSLVAERLARYEGRPVLTSPAIRCQETAKAVAALNGGEITIIDELAEVNYGSWEGLTLAQVRERDRDRLARWRVDSTVAPPYGESAMEHAQRVIRARDKCIEIGPAIIVTHAYTIKQIIRLALDLPFGVMSRMIVQPGSMSVVHFVSSGLGALVALNDLSHLDGELDEKL